MRIVFFGTSVFSAQVLEFLCKQGVFPVAIVTRPDRPQGRALQLAPSPVKTTARRLLPDIPIFQPEKASTDEFCAQLKEFSSDLFLVVAYGEILRKNILSIPAKACVNIHTSLLPKYRGASPIQGCLLQGDDISGVTFMEMALEMDAGDILKQEKVFLGEDTTAGELEGLLLQAVEKGLPELLANFDFYYKNKVRQDESQATFVKKITPEDCSLDWTCTCQELHNRIRALSPRPGAFTHMRLGESIKRVKILKSCWEKASNTVPGSLFMEKKKCKIACRDGYLSPTFLQVEGKKL